jgi:hypothetical protein
MMPISTTELIGRISSGYGPLGSRLVHDLESMALPVWFLVFDADRQELGVPVSQPAAYLFLSDRHLIAISDGEAAGPDLTIIAHEIGHARLTEAGYPLLAASPGLAPTEARYYGNLACSLLTALQDPIINARLTREGYPVEAAYVGTLAPHGRTPDPGDEACRVTYALCLYAHLQVFDTNPTLRNCWDGLIARDPELEEIVVEILNSVPATMTPGAMRQALARFRDRYDPRRGLSETPGPVPA